MYREKVRVCVLAWILTQKKKSKDLFALILETLKVNLKTPNEISEKYTNPINN